MTALEHIRVLDLSRLAPGPFCSMLLGDLGADILLVEAPPQFVAQRPGPEGEEAQERARATSALGRNKRSMVLNLREDEGREIFLRLCEEADVVLEGFRPGVVKRLGVDYEAVSAVNPGIVYCSITGYGQTGPYRDLVGHDINYIALAGALSMIGRPGSPPTIPQNLLADFAGGGLMAAFAILAALLSRQQTGQGQYVDIAMSEGVLALLAPFAGGVLGGGAAPGPGESRIAGGVPHYDTYETADGRWLALGANEPHFWEALCDTVGRPDFKPFQYDEAHHPEIRAHLEQTFKTKTRDQWFEELREVDLCLSPMLGLDETLADPHTVARDMVVEVEDRHIGTVRHIGVAPKFSATPGAVRSTAPRPGEHTDDVLGTLAMDGAAIAGLRERGIVA